MQSLSRSVAIVGAAESDELGIVPRKSALQHHAEAAHNALADAGLSARDVDGLFTAGVSTLTTGEYLGIRPGYVDGTQVGGASWDLFVHHAVGAIESGLCDVALLDYATTFRHHSVDTAAFVALVNRHAGEPMTAFFDQWLNAPITPPLPAPR